MNLATIQQEISEAIAEAEIAKAFNLLKRDIRHESPRRDELSVISANYYRAKSHKGMGVIDFDEFDMRCAQVSDALLSLSRRLKEEDIGNVVNRDAVKNVICTLSVDETAEQDIFLHLNPEFFPNATPANLSDLPTSNQQEDIIIFNAMHIPEEVRHSRLQGAQKSWFDHLEYLVRETDHLILYYGPNYDKINEWRHRVGTANSPFTLYAHLKELSEFITIYRR